MKVELPEVLRRVDEYFAGQSPVHRAAEHVSGALRDLGVPFAVAGALAANAHGNRRTTEDVDLLLTAEGLAAFKARWLGRGWVERFPGSKGMRDAVHNVKVDVLITGEYPGDGKPKPVAFPDPSGAAEVGKAAYPVLKLNTLMEMKLASGMTAPHRRHDLTDVVQLIKHNALPIEHAEKLNPYVREKFRELWPESKIDEDY